jgi:hypothetical protein
MKNMKLIAVLTSSIFSFGVVSISVAIDSQKGNLVFASSVEGGQQGSETTPQLHFASSVEGGQQGSETTPQLS